MLESYMITSVWERVRRKCIWSCFIKEFSKHQKWKIQNDKNENIDSSEKDEFIPNWDTDFEGYLACNGNIVISVILSDMIDSNSSDD